MRAIAALLAATCLALASNPVHAFEPMSGCFMAQQTCEAGRSVRNADNPGQLRLEAGHLYRLLGANKRAATHFQVVVPGADPTSAGSTRAAPRRR
jgi:ribonuclease T2